MRKRGPQRLGCVIACAVILTMLNACGTGSTGSYCGNYEPVYTNQPERDSLRPGTLETIQGNNAVWLELCEQE